MVFAGGGGLTVVCLSPHVAGVGLRALWCIPTFDGFMSSSLRKIDPLLNEKASSATQSLEAEVVAPLDLVAAMEASAQEKAEA